MARPSITTATAAATSFLILALVTLGVALPSSALAQPAPAPGVAPAPLSTPVAPVQPGAVAPSPAAAPPGAPAAAAPPDRQWLRDVYAHAADSVVVIETEAGTGSGFFMRSTQIVATALHVVDDADVISVGTSDGRRQNGRVVAYSREHDVALVQLEHPVPNARPLEPDRGFVEIGESIIVIGHPFSGLEYEIPELTGLLNWSLSQGVVSAVAGSWLQTDAAINPGNSGGPVLNERGQVIGVVSAKLSDAQGIAVAARIHRVEELFKRIGKQSPPRHTWSYDGTELGFVAQIGDDAIEGFSLGTGMRIVKRYPVRMRLGLLAGSVEPTSSTILATRLQRFTGELSIGYAMPLGPIELSPYVGGALFYDHRRNSSLRVDNPALCMTPPCLVDGKVVRESERAFRFLPMAGLSLDYGLLRLGYAYQLALRDAVDSQHRILIGVIF